MTDNVQPLNPIALELGPISVHWYGIIIACGIILGLWIATREADRLGWDKEIIIDFIMIAAPVAIICARIYYVAFEWEHYSQYPSQIIAIWQGGIAIHGALIGAVLTAIIYTRKKNISFWKLADIVAPSLILGQAIGRWGNFMNQEAHGGETTRAFLESLHLPNFIINQMFIDGTYYVPTFLYESSWDLLGFVILFFVLRRLKLKNGELFLSYLVWYSIGRFYVEGLRTDSLMLTSQLRIAQVVSLVLIGIGIIIFVYRRLKIRTHTSG
ncbi:prolipoprotein diacylglyceryl transferase [Filobacillus milosensis]|uniref:Phosphatidylglycerol--prolipoprotein diacylglyceryl transferase n=1 Tax=Filobacillus milosensis TaxID=94137 RepID=A0A4Y8IMH7_9BACI|nr:prolipoprotein diacylglyceryl transferase [Filobacillus milosensis]TFB21418.1 prolipoprotein diacylglyceryl transferase [Filobacillus milosensis]